jgi:hypothetical protein
MPLDPAWRETALSVTGSFENPGDPFSGITGDFDGQGLSLGVLQWNIGQGSLQPLVRAAGQPAVMAGMPVFGGEFWSAVTSTIPQGLAIVRNWQTKNTVRKDVRRELAAFCGGPDMRAQQIAAANHVADIAYEAADNWAQQRGEDEPTKKEFCWFFDLVTQNGSLKGLRLLDVRGFLDQWGDDNADDAVCDWLITRTKSQFGFQDCVENAREWRNKVSDADLDLFILSYLRALKSVFVSQGVVLNRKGTIALTKGWVNRSHLDLSAQLG